MLLLGFPVSAQEQSPELPARGAEGYATGLQFTKGKGPGRGNSYVERFEEDWSYLRDRSRSADVFDPLKFVWLDRDRDFYLTLNGEVRFRYDNTDHKNFAVSPSATPAARPGQAPVFAPAAGTNTNQLYKQRYELGADLHLGPNFRFYADLYHGQQTGHNVGPSVPGNLRSELGLVNAFAEWFEITDTAKTGFRAGRQMVYLGNNLQVRANLSTNLPSPVFDGARLYRDWGFARLDGFAYNIVNFSNDILQDHDNAHTNLWGVYGSLDLPKYEFAALPGAASADLFYLGWRSDTAPNGRGSGVYNDRVFLTGGRIVAATGAGFIGSQDHRHTVGLRYYGKLGDIDFDWQAAYQAGNYAGYNVSAYAANTDTGYTFHDLPWKPRLAAHLDMATGGASHGTLRTYQPMYPNTQYYAPNNEFSPTNFYDFAPRIVLSPTPTVRVEYYYSFLWRYSGNDAIYIGAPWSGGNGQNSYAVTVLSPGKSIGRQSDLRITWTITPHLLFLGEFGLFYPGAALRMAGGRTTTFLDANLTFRF